jgi:hypothetical protein
MVLSNRVIQAKLTKGCVPLAKINFKVPGWLLDIIPVQPVGYGVWKKVIEIEK